MNVCFFGSYDPNYSRNKILIDGLQKNGVNIFHCNSKQGFFVARYPELALKYFRVWRKIDVIFVPFVGQLNVLLAWIFARLTGKRVVFDMFYSMYNTYVFDRKSTSPKSIKAKMYFWIDKLSANLADIVVTDTKAHADYYVRTFHLARHKFKIIYVGGDTAVFKPKRKKTKRKKVVVEFHGMFTRLHGAEYYVQAAKILESEKNLKFLLIGSTNSYPGALEIYKKLRPKNMTHIPKLPIKKLADVVADSDISIGHIGTTEKAHSVITNKSFHAISCKVAAIVGDCRANNEVFIDYENTLFVNMGDARDLAEKIKLLVDKPVLRKKLADNGYKLAKRTFTNERIGRQLLTVFQGATY